MTPEPAPSPQPGTRAPLTRLSVAGLSRDRTRLLLVDAAGTEFSLEVDARLRAALKGESRSGQMENTMESALRPRDIQARIRSGESAEDVAAAAGTPVEKIMIYAAPVLAEREHMAVRAQDSSVRRRTIGDSGARTLGQAVEQQMHDAEADHESIEWDAWQREDRRWVLIASYESRARNGIAEFVFDPRGNYVTTTNDDALWLVGETLPEAAPVRDDLQQARERRDNPELTHPEPTRVDEILTAVEPAEPATTSDVSPSTPALGQAPEVAGEEDDTIDLGETAARIRDMVAAEEEDLAPRQPRTPRVEVAAGAQDVAEPTAEVAEATDSEQLTLDETPAPPAPKKKKSRRSVPSWDEIMFGGGPTKDQ